MVRFFSAFKMLKIGLYDLYSKVIVIGAIVSKLESSSLGQIMYYVSMPLGGRLGKKCLPIDSGLLWGHADIYRSLFVEKNHGP